jgi:hypothetical protein
MSNARTVQLEGELTSVKVSADSHYAIINHLDVRLFVMGSMFCVLTSMIGGLGLGSGPRSYGPEVDWPSTEAACPAELLRGYPRQPRCQWLGGRIRLHLAQGLWCST